MEERIQSWQVKMEIMLNEAVQTSKQEFDHKRSSNLNPQNQIYMSRSSLLTDMKHQEPIMNMNMMKPISASSLSPTRNNGQLGSGIGTGQT